MTRQIDGFARCPSLPMLIVFHGEGAVLVVGQGRTRSNRGERTSCDGLCGKFGARKGYRTPARGQLSHSREEPEARGSEGRVQRQGRRRPNATHKSKVTGAELEISRLQRNGLLTYQAPYVPRAVAELVGSAAACIRSIAAATRALPASRRRDEKRPRTATATRRSRVALAVAAATSTKSEERRTELTVRAAGCAPSP